jgi:hypothetical protein
VARTVEAFEQEGSERSLRVYMDIIKKTTDEFVFSLRSSSHKFRNTKTKEQRLGPVTEKKQLVKLHARIKMAQLRVLAGERRWRALLLKAKVQQVTTPCACYSRDSIVTKY